MKIPQKFIEKNKFVIEINKIRNELYKIDGKLRELIVSIYEHTK